MAATRFALLFVLQVLLMPSSIAGNNYGYNARIQCGNSNVTNNEYFSAANDMEARNEVMRLMNNRTDYRGRGCRLIELTSDRPQPARKQSRSYEVRIQCGSNTSSGSTQYFSADSDLEAENEARRILNNNTSFRGRGCQIVELNAR
jgi:hypothetical protein